MQAKSLFHNGVNYLQCSSWQGRVRWFSNFCSSECLIRARKGLVESNSSTNKKVHGPNMLHVQVFHGMVSKM
ncbi:hypothetical protein VNO77_01355 [Canavalia gladiata]|uniref:Uncharacterized protein n=1 Tax=Canavalia gladiata TaxID=3824 RepID=A0AAN9MRQ3_CANGL